MTSLLTVNRHPLLDSFPIRPTAARFLNNRRNPGGQFALRFIRYPCPFLEISAKFLQ
jgi:hypothetical protein